ncbi:gustatory receptor for sugar taste 43a-like [Achroia grisella]|uniref:gustatory receptor for sugar taste 43a-like n=1 Tax=Achroia grisella TaxID=688607 RepID=UPI0027D232F2|nr:gustatory receptor for sugar taste 43a-like [Achroia grisella]
MFKKTGVVRRYEYFVTPIYVKELGVESTKVEDTSGSPVGTARSRAVRPTHCVVAGAHALVLRVSSIFGLAPLRFEPCGSGFSVSISNAMCIYSYILVTVLVVLTISGLVAEINVGLELAVRMSSTTSQVVSMCDILIVVLTAGAGVYGAPKRMRSMLKFMNSIASVDTSIGGKYTQATERKVRAVLLAILIYFFVLLIDDLCFYVVYAKKVGRQWNVLLNYIGFYVLWYMVMILELQFAFTALSVRARFQAINDALVLTVKNTSIPMSAVEKTRSPASLNIFAISVTSADSQRIRNVNLTMDTHESEPTVIVSKSVAGESRLMVSASKATHQLSMLHGALCDVVHRIDSSYGLPVIVILMSTLLHLIVTPYFLIMELIVYTNRLHFLVLQFLWCFTHLLRLVIIVEPCHYTIIEGKRTQSLVSRLMSLAPSTGELSTRLVVFCRQLMLQAVSYMPMGMCTLDRPLVASILGAVTTYLVILIQFQRYDTT